MEKKDFFISYTTSDEKWATWIAGVLEANGYTTYLQAWDFKPGGNFVLNMDEGLRNCERFIAVLSSEYMEKVYCQAEWAAAFAKDKDSNGEEGLLIPIRIDDCKPEGLLKSIIYIDLFGVNEKEAEERMKRITEEGRPRNKPGYPGTKKSKFPGQLPFNNIPYTKNFHFTGRKEILDEMKKSLKPGEKNPYAIALWGMGAVGKTQIALAYAINNGYLYDTIWWVNAESDVTILNSYNDLLRQKGIIKKNELYEREADLTQYLPRSNMGHILVTARNSKWHNMEKIEVDVFHPNEAVEFLESFKLE